MKELGDRIAVARVERWLAAYAARFAVGTVASGAGAEGGRSYSATSVISTSH